MIDLVIIAALLLGIFIFSVLIGSSRSGLGAGYSRPPQPAKTSRGCRHRAPRIYLLFGKKVKPTREDLMSGFVLEMCEKCYEIENKASRSVKRRTK